MKAGVSMLHGALPLRMPSWLRITMVLCAAGAAAGAAGATQLPVMLGQPVQEEEEINEQELEEIIISGRTLRDMRQALLEAEQRFYERYNEVNENDDFDINCSENASLGTRIKRRQCLIVFQEKAQVEYAQARIAGYYAPDPLVVTLERRNEFRASALSVLNSDARLRRLLRERQLLEEKFLAERKKRMQGRWILIE